MTKEILYHLSHTDLDGYGCQMVVKFFQDNYRLYHSIRYYNADYGNDLSNKLKEVVNDIANVMVNDSVIDNATLLITDLNLSMEDADWLEECRTKMGFNLVLLDHHLSGGDVAEKYSTWYKLSLSGNSATYLTYDFCKHSCQEWGEVETIPSSTNTRDIKFLVEIIDAYDTWKDDRYSFHIGKILTAYLKMMKYLLPYKLVSETYRPIFIDYLLRLSSEFPKGLNGNHELTIKNDLGYSNNIQIQYEIVAFDRLAYTGVYTAISDYYEKLNGGVVTGFITPIVTDIVEGAYNRVCDPMPVMVENMIADEIAEHFLLDELREYSIVDDQGHVLGFYLTPVHISSGVMNRVLKRTYLDGIVVANNINNPTCSIRSLGDFDVSSIAKKLGGGGHLNAAGFKVNLTLASGLPKSNIIQLKLHVENAIKG